MKLRELLKEGVVIIKNLVESLFAAGSDIQTSHSSIISFYCFMLFVSKKAFQQTMKERGWKRIDL